MSSSYKIVEVDEFIKLDAGEDVTSSRRYDVDIAPKSITQTRGVMITVFFSVVLMSWKLL